MPINKDEAKDVIKFHGGPTALARKLGFDLKKSGSQRVINWYKTGFPSKIQLENPWIEREYQRSINK